MATSGGQPGNQNAKKAKRWHDAINRALAKVDVGAGVDAGIDKCATQLVNAAVNGEQWAIKELGDRLDGKPHQSVAVDGDGEGGPIKTVSEVLLRAVDATHDRPTS